MNICLTQSEWKNVQEVVLRDNNCTTIHNVVAEHAEENELDTWQEQLRRSGDHDGGNRERATRPTEVRSCRACVNIRVHTLAVLVLCIFCTCRAFRHLEVFLSRCLFVKFVCAPVSVCLKGP